MSQLIYKKMAEIMKEIGPVTKDKTNTAQGFKFRGIDQFINALHPALVKYGVFMTPRSTAFTKELKDVVRSSGKAGVDAHVTLMMEYDFYAEDGSKVTIGPVPSEGMDTGDKATNKALSAALKYALIQTFAVPTEDMEEADKDSPTISKSVAKAQPATVTHVSGPVGTIPTTVNITPTTIEPPAAASPPSNFTSFRNRKAGSAPAAPSNAGGLNL